MIKKLFVSFSRLPKRNKIILFGVVFFISFVFPVRLMLGSILSKIKLLNKEIQSQEVTIRKSLQMLSQKDRIEKEVDKYTFFATVAQSQEEEIVILLKDIEELANKCSVYMIDIKPAGFTKEGILKKYLVRLNCEAQMEQIAEFFYKLESSKGLLKIEKYDIRPKTEGSSIVRCAMSISKAVLP